MVKKSLSKMPRTKLQYLLAWAMYKKDERLIAEVMDEVEFRNKQGVK